MGLNYTVTAPRPQKAQIIIDREVDYGEAGKIIFTAILTDEEGNRSQIDFDAIEGEDLDDLHNFIEVATTGK